MVLRQEHFAIRHVRSHARLLQTVYSNTDAWLYLRTGSQALSRQTHNRSWKEWSAISLRILQHQRLQKTSPPSPVLSSSFPGTSLPAPFSSQPVPQGITAPMAQAGASALHPLLRPAAALGGWMLTSLCSANCCCVMGKLTSHPDSTPARSDPAAPFLLGHGAWQFC